MSDWDWVIIGLFAMGEMASLILLRRQLLVANRAPTPREYVEVGVPAFLGFVYFLLRWPV